MGDGDMLEADEIPALVWNSYGTRCCCRFYSDSRGYC
jgi:hypothetical protein